MEGNVASLVLGEAPSIGYLASDKTHATHQGACGTTELFPQLLHRLILHEDTANTNGISGTPIDNGSDALEPQAATS